MILKGVLFALPLIAAAYIDQRSREIPDILCILTALCGLIDFSPLLSLEGAAAVFAVLMVCRLTIGGIGGGDIKLFTACGFVLGPAGGLISVALSYLCFICTSLLLRRKLKGSYPLAPCIATGSILASLII